MGGPGSPSIPKRRKTLGVRTRHGGAVNGAMLQGPPHLFTITPSGGAGRKQHTPGAISTEPPPSAGFRVSPDEGVNLGKTGAVRQSIQAAGLIEDAGRVMQEFVADIFDPNPALDHITSALGMASVLLESSMGTSTGRSNMPGLGGQSGQQRWRRRTCCGGRRPRLWTRTPSLSGVPWQSSTPRHATWLRWVWSGLTPLAPTWECPSSPQLVYAPSAR